MKKVIIVGFDGLRADFITQEKMPNLYKFLKEDSICFENHKSAFPTETYVNLPSIFTGCLPQKHGIIANAFLDPEVEKKELFNGSQVSSVERYGDQLFSVPSLGEILASNGKELVVFSSNSAGSTRLMHHTAKAHNGYCISTSSFELSVPKNIAKDLEDKIGSLGKKAFPDFAGISWMTNAFFDYVLLEPLPDCTVLWYGEPDNAFHVYGLSSSMTNEALAAADDEFARFIEWWHKEGKKNGVQLILMSDHGHITQLHKFSLKQALENKGFHVDKTFENGADLALSPGYCANIRVKHSDREMIQQVCQALMSMDEVGMIFTRSDTGDHLGHVQGTFSIDFVGCQHPERATDIYVILRTSDELDPYGYAGYCWFDNTLLSGATIHGGLHPSELNSFFAISVDETNSAGKNHYSTHSCDVTPTVLGMLGIEIDASSFDGNNVLTLLDCTTAIKEDDLEMVIEGLNGYKQKIIWKQRNDFIYIQKGYRVS